MSDKVRIEGALGLANALAAKLKSSPSGATMRESEMACISLARAYCEARQALVYIREGGCADPAGWADLHLPPGLQSAQDRIKELEALYKDAKEHADEFLNEIKDLEAKLRETCPLKKKP